MSTTPILPGADTTAIVFIIHTIAPFSKGSTEPISMDAVLTMHVLNVKTIGAEVVARVGNTIEGMTTGMTTGTIMGTTTDMIMDMTITGIKNIEWPSTNKDQTAQGIILRRSFS